MQSGDSAIFRVTDVTPEGRFDLRVEGKLLYDELFRDPDRVLDSCRIKGSDSEGGSGSWRVMSKLEKDGDGFENVDAEYPSYILNSITATIETFDRQTGDITVTASSHGGFDHDRYIEWHRSATDDRDEVDDYTTLVAPGNLFILDPYPDSYPATRAYEALSRTASNSLYNRLNDVFEKGETSHLKQSVYPEDSIDEFLNRFEEATGEAPRDEQRKFVKETDNTVAVLQGPQVLGRQASHLHLPYSLVCRLLKRRKMKDLLLLWSQLLHIPLLMKQCRV
jgi:hypothetical protein